MTAIARRSNTKLERFKERASDPGAVTDVVQVYGKDSSGTTHLFAQDSAGTIHQITPPTTGSYTVTAIKTANYTATIDELVRCNSSGGAFTVTLPAASGVSGKAIIVKNVNGSATTITIDGNASETIDGSLTIVIERGFAAVELRSDGTNWMIV